MKAIVNVPICALLAAPTRESTLEDEALYGMVVDILEKPAPAGTASAPITAMRVSSPPMI